MKRFKILALSLLLIVTSQSVFSAPSKPLSPVAHLRTNYVYAFEGTPFTYYTELGKTEKELLKEISILGVSYKNINDKQKLILVGNMNGIINARINAVYLIESGKVTGYCLIEPVDIDEVSNTNPEMDIMRTLPINSSYLSEKISLVPSDDIKAINYHEKDHDNYIERYGLAKFSTVDRNFDKVVLEAFYPKNLESEFEPYIIKELNAIVKSYRLE